MLVALNGCLVKSVKQIQLITVDDQCSLSWQSRWLLRPLKAGVFYLLLASVLKKVLF